ncbi:MAG: serine hydrolase [Pikeienuella sp.]
MIRYIAPLFAALLAAQPASAFDTAASAAMVVDMTSGAVLLEKNPDKPLPPASMSKLMTLDLVFEALQSGRLTLNETFPVSEKAWKMGGSRMFVRAGERVAISDLLRGVVVQSGNDACVVLAEGLAGSEEAFARRMNERAKELGMNGSHFINSTGWPAPDHRMTVRDLMTLVDRMVNVFPEYYPVFSETEFEWDGVKQRNRNPLLYLDLGADGLKTGHTEEAGYGLTGSAVRDGRRIGFVLAGLPSLEARSQEAERIVTWAFREFRTDKVASAGQIVGAADVWIGAEATVPLAPERDIVATAPWSGVAEVKATIRYDGPVPAPIAAGDRIGELVIEAPGLAPVSTPLVAAAAVAKGGLSTRVRAAIGTLLRGEDPLAIIE